MAPNTDRIPTAIPSRLLSIVLGLACGIAFSLAIGATASGADAAPKGDAVAGIPLAPDAGRIVFYRPPAGITQILWSGLKPAINLNGQAVGKSEPGHGFYVDRPAGNYEVSVTTDEERTIDFRLNAGQTRYVRTVLTPGDPRPLIAPELVEPEAAQKEAAKLTIEAGAP